MIYLNNITTYIEELCTEHVDLRHGTNGTAFVPLFPSDESVAGTPGMKQRYVKIMDISQSGTDEHTLLWSVQIAFLKNVPVKENQRSGIDTAWNEMQRIMWDFDARMRQDADEDDRCFFANNLLNPNAEPMERVDQSAFGWLYTWRFTTDKPRHDPARWV